MARWIFSIKIYFFRFFTKTLIDLLLQVKKCWTTKKLYSKNQTAQFIDSLKTKKLPNEYIYYCQIYGVGLAIVGQWFRIPLRITTRTLTWQISSQFLSSLWHWLFEIWWVKDSGDNAIFQPWLARFESGSIFLLKVFWSKVPPANARMNSGFPATTISCFLVYRQNPFSPQNGIFRERESIRTITSRHWTLLHHLWSFNLTSKLAVYVAICPTRRVMK